MSASLKIVSEQSHPTKYHFFNSFDLQDLKFFIQIIQSIIGSLFSNLESKRQFLKLLESKIDHKSNPQYDILYLID